MIDKNMEVKKISDIAYVTDYIASGSFAKLKENVEYRYEPDYAILVRLTDYKSNWNGDFVYIPEHSYEFLHNSNLTPGDIVISNVGAYAGAVFTVPDLGRPMSLGPNAVVVKPYNDDRKFLYYYFLSYYGQGMIKTIISGSAQPKFNKTDFRKLEIPIPPLPIQQKIASVLYAYDALITNNTRRIQILEEMAQLIYREWFVYYRFPGHQQVKMVDSGTEFGEIPEGWEIVKIRDISTLHRGKSYRSIDLNPEGLPFLNLKCIERDGGFRYDGIKYYSGKFKQTQTAKPGDIIIALTDMTQERRIIGRVARVPKSKTEFYVMSMDILKVKPVDDNLSHFVYSTLRYSSFPTKIREFANGVNVLHLSPMHIEDAVILMPQKHLIERFTDVIKPSIELIDNLNNKNMILIQGRDLLIPKLISGELDVSDLDIDIT